MWVAKLFIQEFVLTMILSFVIYGAWRFVNPGRKW